MDYLTELREACDIAHTFHVGEYKKVQFFLENNGFPKTYQLHKEGDEYYLQSIERPGYSTGRVSMNQLINANKNSENTTWMYDNVPISMEELKKKISSWDIEKS